MKGKKYSRLTHFFANKANNEIYITFNEIENIIGFKLPPSARKYKAFWYGESQDSFRIAWIKTGYKVTFVDLTTEVVKFNKNLNNDKNKYKKFLWLKKDVESYFDEILLDVPINLIGLENDEYLMVKMNKNNSFIIEKEINEDSKYKQKSFIICQKRFIENEDYSYEAFYEVIKAISIENSTRTSGKNLELIAKYLSDIENKFLVRLEEGKPELVDELIKYVKNNGVRNEKSLISKICKYLSQWLYDDAYTINDSVVRKVLPYYLAYYKINRSLWENKDLDKISYVEFINIFDLVKERVKVLTRHEIDHLLWYSYKNDPIRSSIASSLALYLNK